MNRLKTFRAVRRAGVVGVTLACCVAIAPLLTSARAQSPAGIQERETPVVRAVRRITPSVANIHGQKAVRNTAAGMAGAVGDAVRQVNGMGTGIIIDSRGYLVTNYHVVEDVSDIRVTLADKRTAIAEVIASDSTHDLAVLKIDLDGPLQVVPLGTSDDLMVGERVIAIGNAFGYENTVTEGIISALHRDVPVNDTQEYRDLIQTSAGINPGNSGGPLLNIHGDVIGINVAVRVGAQAIAFAIPIDQAIEVSRNILRDYNASRLTMGIVADANQQDENGVFISALAENGPAAVTGLRTGDRIVRIGDRDIETPLDFELALIGFEPGQPITMDVERAGQSSSFAVHAAEPQYGTDPRLIASRIWTIIGVQAEPLTATALRQLNIRLRTDKPYRGGLRIISVRPGSPADRQLIRAGDVLLGIHGWQTANLQDLDLILRSEEMKHAAQADFYIVRRDQTLVGQLRLATSEPAANRGR